MGAVALALRDQGYTVSGSDNAVYPPMSTFLRDRDIELLDGYRPENIPATADLIVVGNAISRGNPELEAVLDRCLWYLSLPETLRHFFLRGRQNIVVSGTHGKTTTTSLLTHILRVAGFDPAFMIGGIAEDLGKGCSLHESPLAVLEGDEYDTAFFDKRSKFLHYLPWTVLINNVEFDHADIYDDLRAVEQSFRRLVSIVPQGGIIFYNADDDASIRVATASDYLGVKQVLARTSGVGFSERAHLRITDPVYTPDGSAFTLGEARYQIGMVGDIYIRNAAMAAAAALHHGAPVTAVQTALAGFRGVKRRQDIRGVRRGVTIVEDFGHHPTAIRASLAGLRHRFPLARIWAITEPRSNTMRRRVMQDALTDALTAADGAVIAQVARLEQLPAEERLEPAAIAAELARRGKPAYFEVGPAEIVARLTPLAAAGDVVVVFSNGGFGGIYDLLLSSL
jgi:UDP-N-acetylmuramate: L-alanyl-gamma-D-glutamyl-meso-diaminopimelate ligase